MLKFEFVKNPLTFINYKCNAVFYNISLPIEACISLKYK